MSRNALFILITLLLSIDIDNWGMFGIFEGNNFIVFIVSIFVSNIAVYPVRNFGLKLGIIDKYEKRKDFKGVIVRIGGISIMLGCFISIYLCSYFLDFQFNNQIIELSFISFLFFCIGFTDDIFSIKPKPRLALQSFATLIALSFLENMNFPIFRDLISGNYKNELFILISIIFTVFWITGVTNAINWTDGLDGLAGGVSVVLSSGLFFIFLSLDLYDYALYAIAIAGACYGFLIHNYKPASILMGDGGSYFLGFNLASLSLIASNAIFFKSEIGNAFFISLFPFLLLGVPIIDMFFVILIRIYNSKSPFYPDRNHLHHRLLSLGINYKGTISTILLLNITFVSLVYLFFSKREFIFISLTFYTLLLLSLKFLKKFLILK